MCAAHAKSSDDVFFNIRLKPDMHARLTELAKRNERTTSAEIRVAIRQYLEQAKAAEVAA